MTEEQLQSLGTTIGDDLFTKVGSDRLALSGALGYIVSHIADLVTQEKGLVEGTDLVFLMADYMSDLADAGEKGIIAEFNGRSNELLAQVLKL